MWLRVDCSNVKIGGPENCDRNSRRFLKLVDVFCQETGDDGLISEKIVGSVRRPRSSCTDPPAAPIRNER